MTTVGMASVAVIAGTVAHHPHGVVIAVYWSAASMAGRRCRKGAACPAAHAHG
ncbi:hypothetical protein XMIN_1529 [Xanthomonas citri pv. mangiferaeindicae LMG 941]|nr:hypothetical protein XMIN_1529 [Xanthomonas citri pv. mangiferaeindicae LMG 941]